MTAAVPAIVERSATVPGDGEAATAASVVPLPSTWDEELAATGGHLLQSSRWADFKALFGWRAERVRVEADGVGLAQVLFRHRGPISVGYVPRGPVLTSASPVLAARLFAEVDRVCREQRALVAIVEPDAPLPYAGRYRDAGFVRGPEHIQPNRTVKVPLLPDDALLNQMHQKTRYNIKLAQRRGVVAVRAEPTAEAMATFYALLRDTAGRNEFGVHAPDYYADFVRIFDRDAVLLFALIEGTPVAGVIAARFGAEAIYMYGASSTQHRAHGAGFYLQFEAMRWARELGCARYDLWGIPAEDPTTTAVDGGNRVAGTRGNDWRGLFEFKVRFGGEIVGYPPALERRYRPLLAGLARRVYRPGA